MSRETADLVIVGAGIMGLSIAHQVARRSGQRVVVLERGPAVAQGSTGASSAICRQRYTHPEVIRMARYGLLAYRDWSSFTGLDEPRGVFSNVGVLWMTGEGREPVAAQASQLAAEGAETAVLDAEEVERRFPALSTAPVPVELGGPGDAADRDAAAYLFEEEGGYFDPVGACEDLAEAAVRGGVEVRLRSPVTGVRTAGGRVAGVDLADGGGIDAGTVVNATGPWCNHLNRLAGVDLGWPLVPTRVQVLYRSLPAEVPQPVPVVADASTGIYFRPEAAGQQVLAGSVREEDEQEEVDPDHYNTNADRVFLDTKIHGLHHRIPKLPHRGSLTGIAGLYCVNRADVHPVIGPTELGGYFVANGFSGHGFKLGPAVGSLLARLVTGEELAGDVDVPLDFFSPGRKPLAVRAKNVLA